MGGPGSSAAWLADPCRHHGSAVVTSSGLSEKPCRSGQGGIRRSPAGRYMRRQHRHRDLPLAAALVRLHLAFRYLAVRRRGVAMTTKFLLPGPPQGGGRRVSPAVSKRALGGSRPPRVLGLEHGPPAEEIPVVHGGEDVNSFLSRADRHGEDGRWLGRRRQPMACGAELEAHRIIRSAIAICCRHPHLCCTRGTAPSGSPASLTATQSISQRVAPKPAGCRTMPAHQR
jgi:hypothetical protein